MQNVQVMHAVIWEQRRHQRVCYGFEGAVGNRENEGPRPEINKSRLRRHPRRCTKSDGCGNDVEEECCNNELTVTNLVDNDPSDNDAKTEPGKPRTIDQSHL